MNETYELIYNSFIRPMPDGPQPEYLKHSSMTKSASHLSSRRSKQARSRAKKMRQMYEQQREVKIKFNIISSVFSKTLQMLIVMK